MSLNIKKQRQYLYKMTFMLWNVEQRLSTFQKSAIEVSLAVNKFGTEASDANFNKLCENVSDIETMIEVIELTFAPLREEVERIKKQKLVVLQRTTRLNQEANGLEEKAGLIKKEASEVFQKLNQKKSFFQKLLFWK